MSLLGYERGAAAATNPIRYQAELDRLFLLAKERGLDRRPAHPPAAGVVLQQGADDALPRHAHADPVPRRPPAGPRRGDHQAVLERVPPGGHRAGDRHPRRRGHGAVGPQADAARSAPTTPARRTRRRRGSTRSSTPGRRRSTPARRRSSATSSARWCSACPKEPKPAELMLRDRAVAVAVRGTRGCGRSRCGSGGARRRRGGGGGGRSCRCRRGSTCASGCSPSTGIPRPTRVGADVVNYLAWCRTQP